MTKKTKNDIVSNDLLEKLPDILTIFLAALLLFQETVHRMFHVNILNIHNNDWKDLVITSLVVFLVITLFKRLNRIDVKFDKVIGNHLGIVEVLNPHQNIDIVDLLTRKKNIRILTLSGSTTGRLGDDNVINTLKNNKNSNIQILLANPFSEAIISRYCYDEPDTCISGVEGIKNRLIMLQRLKNSLNPNISKKIDVRVFDNYPIISVIQADNDIYSSVYAYRLRGSDCPIVHAEKGTVYGEFLLKHFDGVCDNSLKLEKWIEKYNITI